MKTEEFEGKEGHFSLHQAINSFKLETWAEKFFSIFKFVSDLSPRSLSFGFRCCLASGSSSVCRSRRFDPANQCALWWCHFLCSDRSSSPSLMCLRCELEPPNTLDRSEKSSQMSFSSDLVRHIMVRSSSDTFFACLLAKLILQVE